MGVKRQNDQLVLAFPAHGKGEAPTGVGGGTEAPTAKRGTQSPAAETAHLMEEVCESANLYQAMAQVVANHGGAGVDGMRVEQLPPYVEAYGTRPSRDIATGFAPSTRRSKPWPRRRSI